MIIQSCHLTYYLTLGDYKVKNIEYKSRVSEYKLILYKLELELGIDTKWPLGVWYIIKQRCKDVNKKDFLFLMIYCSFTIHKHTKLFLK